MSVQVLFNRDLARTNQMLWDLNPLPSDVCPLVNLLTTKQGFEPPINHFLQIGVRDFWGQLQQTLKPS